jgi:hypothetical protein
MVKLKKRLNSHSMICNILSGAKAGSQVEQGQEWLKIRVSDFLISSPMNSETKTTRHLKLLDRDSQLLGNLVYLNQNWNLMRVI